MKYKLHFKNADLCVEKVQKLSFEDLVLNFIAQILMYATFHLESAKLK